MPKLYIDNKPYEVKPGKNLLETCLSLGLDVPYFCWHPALGSVGACRQCAIKVFKDENDKKGKLIMSCMEPVIDNQRISVSDPEAKEFREHIIGWLMTNHPHDCAVCDEGGSCHLQDMTVMTGHAYRNFKYKKRTYKNQYLGPFINHEMNRCIQCYRCVRFYRDYAGGRDLDAFASKNQVYFGRHEEGVLESEFSGNLAEVCPTGVFTDKTLKEHYTRKWDLTMAPSICQHCSLGCNTIAGERYGSLRLITSRYHGEVNGYFICDRGRFGYEFVNAPTRIRKPLMSNQPVTRDEIIKQTASLIKPGKVMAIGSPRASLESNFVLRKLVGDKYFFQGVSEKEYRLTTLVKDVLSKGGTRTPSMKEVEKSDTVLVLGEDLTNTAPMLALAIRQSVRQQPLKKISKVNIPAWNDSAVREFVQDENGPLFIATVTATKLDDVATSTWHASPDNIARIGFAVANSIDSTAAGVTDLSKEEKNIVQAIAKALTEAERPVIISGTSCGSEAVIQAAANIAWALQKRNDKTGIVLTLPESNSLGLSKLGGQSLKNAFEGSSSGFDTVVILENDLYRHAKGDDVTLFLSKFKSVIVLDHTTHATTQKSTHTIPAGTFAEADGILVNNEGRAQRFVQVYQPADDVQESWRWLLQLAAELKTPEISNWKNNGDVIKAIAREIEELKEVIHIAPPSDHRINGQKIPRQPHRYSGRTSMLANINVSEPKPPEDQDSPLSYTMEGLRELPPSTLVPFFWSPGWNSVQSINKYQEEVGGALRGGDPGIRLIEPKPNGQVNYFNSISKNVETNAGKLLAVYLHHIFGSDELSALSPGVTERSPKPYAMMNSGDAETLKVKQDAKLSFGIEKHQYELPVKLSNSIAKGVVGLPFGLPGMPYADLPMLIEFKNNG